MRESRSDAPQISASLERTRKWVKFRHVVAEFFTQLVRFNEFVSIGSLCLIILVKVMPKDQAVALVLSYVSSGAVVWYLYFVRRHIVECWSFVPISPHLFLYPDFYHKKLLIAYAVGLPFFALLATVYVFGLIPFLKAAFCFFGCIIAAVLTFKHAMNPFIWDGSLFCLPWVVKFLKKILKKWDNVFLALAFPLVYILFFWGSSQMPFFKHGVGTFPLLEIAYFFVNPVGSILRMVEGNLPRIAAMFTAILLVAGGVALLSIYKMLRQPVKILETAEFEAYHKGIRAGSYLGHLGGVAKAKEGSPEGTKQESISGTVNSTFEELEKAAKRPYIETSTPEVVLAETYPLQTRGVVVMLTIFFLGCSFSAENEHYIISWEFAKKLFSVLFIPWCFLTPLIFINPKPKSLDDAPA